MKYRKKIGFSDHEWRIVFTAPVLFFLVYDVSLVGLGVFTTARLAVILLLLLYGRNGVRDFVSFGSKHSVIVLPFLFVCIYSFALVKYSVAGENIIFARSFWFFLYSIFVPFLLFRLCNGCLKVFLVSYFMSAIAQAGFVYLSMIVPEYRIWMLANITLGGNIDVIGSFRSLGFSGAGGAVLSLQLGLGFLAGILYLGVIERHSFLKVTSVFFGLAIILFAEFFVGRTGLLFCIASLLFYTFFNFKIAYKRLITLAFFGLAIVFVINYTDFTIASYINYDYDSIMEWSYSGFSLDEDSTANALASQLNDTPHLTSGQLFFGTGLVSNADGSNFSGSDSGYLQNIYSLGLAVSFLFYGAVFLMLLHFSRDLGKIYRGAGIFVFLSCFVLEIKEPFIQKYSGGFKSQVQHSRHRVNCTNGNHLSTLTSRRAHDAGELESTRL